MMDGLAFVMGMTAGLLLLVSGLPMIIEQLKHPNPGTPGERRSRLLMALGNAIWVVSGLLSGNPAIILMCAINAAIQMAIWRRMSSKNSFRES